jgi:cytidylate kinase
MMPHSNSVERVTGALARAQQHWQERRGAAAGGQDASTASGFTIALSRESGTSGSLVAHELGARLGWPVYHHELLEHIAQEMGLRVNLLHSIDEKRQSWLRESLEAFCSVPSVSESAYVSHLIETILSLGAHGHGVIVGRGAAHILPAQTTLRVRLVAPLEDRITAVSHRLGISRSEAARQIDATDRERNSFIKAHFLKDPTAPQQYDLLLNSWRWSTDEVVDTIVQSLRRLERRADVRS